MIVDSSGHHRPSVREGVGDLGIHIKHFHAVETLAGRWGDGS